MGERTLTFSVEGEFITRLAREELYCDGKALHAMNLLLSCMAGTDLPEYQLREMAFSILDGYAEISGVYPGDDYGYNHLEKKDSKWGILEHIEKLANENKRIQKELDRMTQRCNLAMEKLSDTEIRKVYVDMGEAIPEELDSTMSGMLESYIKRATDTKEHSTDDYGWLEPDGTFHAVEWGMHEGWASDYMREHMSEEEWLNDMTYRSGDYLTERGWVLLHNPSQGIAFPTRNPVKRYTKAQKEFLYDYYIERGCEKEANEVYEEDD